MGWDGPMTHRQYLTWQAWLDEQWNTPTKQEHYLANLTAEVRRGWVSKPRDVDTKDFLLRFTFPQLPEPMPNVLASEVDVSTGEVPNGVPLPRRMTQQDIINVHKQSRAFELGMRN